MIARRAAMPKPHRARWALGCAAPDDGRSRDFVPARRHVRTETIDPQRGEAERDGGHLHCDQFEYSFGWQLLPLADDQRTAGTVNRHQATHEEPTR